MTTWNNGSISSTSRSPLSGKNSGPLILEIRTICLRVRLAFRPGIPMMKRIHRVRVLFPDLGVVPVIDSVGFERLTAAEAIREFPAVREVRQHLSDLTKIH